MRTLPGGVLVANLDGVTTDPVNGLGGAGGGFPVPGTSLTIVIPAAIASGAYQVRVIGLLAAGEPVGSFSGAVTVVVP